MTTVMFLGGIFNIVDPVLGIQLYMWSWLLIVILWVVVWVGFKEGAWKAYEPLHGMYHAFKARSKAAFIFNRRFYSNMVSEREAKCIFDYSKCDYIGIQTAGDFFSLGKHRLPVIADLADWIQRKLFYYPTVFLDIDPGRALLNKLGGVNMDVEIAKKMQNYEWDDNPSVNSGGILIDIILDTDRWTVRDSPQHKIIERTAEMWNELNSEDQIHSYSKFQRYLVNGRLSCPEGLNPVEIVSWPRMYAGCPVNMPDNIMAGARRQQAAEEEDSANNPFSKYYMIIILGSLGLAVLILVFRFAALMISRPPT